MTDFATWLDQAWTVHADHPAAVAARIEAEGSALAASDGDVHALARLSHHVHGDHLGGEAGRLAAGRAQLARLAAHAQAGEGARAGIALLDASLVLTGGGPLAEGLGPASRIRVQALAASNLAERDSARAAALLEQALAEEEIAGLPDTDPAVRALAVTGNNLAAALEEKATRSAGERTLMILAARTGRACWERAGTWLETERAEYRLARTWLAAGDAVQARRHAQACLEIVREHGDVALEAFFGWEALGCVEAAAGNRVGLAEALAQARAAFERLEAGDQGWCRAELDKLAAR
jgi:hypothetical protein